MRRRNRDNDGGLSQHDPAFAMPENDSDEIGPTQARLLDECLHPGNHFLGIGLVIDMRDPRRALGVITNQAVEHHDSTTLRATQPLVRDPHIKRMVRKCDPCGDVGRRYGHPSIVVGGAVTDAGHPTIVDRMPPDLPDNNFGDEAGDGNEFGAHPHPDDRLWRHPSESQGQSDRTDSARNPESRNATINDGREPLRSMVRSGPSVLLPLALIALVLGSGLTLAALSVVGAFDPPPARIVVEKIETNTDANLTTSEVVDRVRPTVVRIETTRGGVVSSGTGVIYRSDGYVLTTADAVARADSVLVITTDGRSAPARVVGIDFTDDIAVLSTNLTDIESAVLGNTDELEPGETVLALSLDTSVTDPITSREVIADSSRRLDAIGGSTLHDMIAAAGTETRFDDGVMCSDTGAVLGIFTTRAADPTATANGGVDLPNTRFATSIDYAVKVADSIVRSGVARIPWLGVMSDDLDSITTARLGRSGTILSEISPDGPADVAGLQMGDVVVSIDDSPISSATSLVVALRSREVGDSVTISYIRDGAQRVTTTILGNRP